MDEAERPKLIFPDNYSIKAVGKDLDNFAEYAKSIVESIIERKDTVKYTVRESKNGSYISVTINFTANNQQEHDLVFSTMSAADRVLWVL